jgi:uncharacterized membrane protein YecN with MAPEG domain
MRMRRALRRCAMLIVSGYAALLGLLFVELSLRTLRLRRALRIAIGDADNPQLIRAIRVHSNFAEYVPFGLLLVYLCEVHRAGPIFIHLMGVALLVGRLSHAYGLGQVREDYRYRVAGMALTLGTIVAASAFLLWTAARSVFAGG